MNVVGICPPPQDFESKALLVDKLDVDRLSTPAALVKSVSVWPVATTEKTHFAGQPLPISSRFELYCVCYVDSTTTKTLSLYIHDTIRGGVKAVG